MNFIVGHYYRCIVRTRGPGWNASGYMDPVIGKDRVLCTSTGEMSNSAGFDVTPDRDSGDPEHIWWWNHGEFIDVTDEQPEVKQDSFIRHDLEL